MPRNIRLLVLHCSATPNARTLFSGQYWEAGFRTPVMEIDAWHKARGFERDPAWRRRQNPPLEAVGYHYVIARNAAVFSGRHEDEVGAHAQGWNSVSLGLCLVGTDQFTTLQWLVLRRQVELLAAQYALPLEPPRFAQREGRWTVTHGGVCGHRDLPGVAKLCPGFDVSAWLAGGLAPLAGHVAAEEAR